MFKYNGQYVLMFILMVIGNFANTMVSGGSSWTIAITGTAIIAALSHAIIETLTQISQKKISK
jgi:hypothetical protein